MDLSSQVWAQPWVPFLFGCGIYLIKMSVDEKQLQYCIMITDGQSVWIENLGRKGIESRVKVFVDTTSGSCFHLLYGSDKVSFTALNRDVVAHTVVESSRGL